MLFSLEGLRNLDWPRLLKLQMEDGSFLTCPSSTAIAFMETNDDKCFKFLKNVVEKCNGGGTIFFLPKLIYTYYFFFVRAYYYHNNISGEISQSVRKRYHNLIEIKRLLPKEPRRN